MKLKIEYMGNRECVWEEEREREREREETIVSPHSRASKTLVEQLASKRFCGKLWNLIV